MIGAGRLHLAHDVDHDAAGVAQRKPEVAAGIVSAQPAAYLLLCAGHGESRDGHRSYAREGDSAFRRNGIDDGLLRVAIDVDDNLVAGAQDIVGRRGHVEVGREAECALVEDIASEHFLASGLAGDVLRGLHVALCRGVFLGSIHISLAGRPPSS